MQLEDANLVLKLIQVSPRFRRRYLRKSFKDSPPGLEDVAKKTASFRDRWVRRLPSVIAAMNRTKTRLIKMKPIDAIKLPSVKQNIRRYGKRLVGIREPLIPNRTPVRYLYFPGELEGGEKKRATDPVWSLEPYQISWSMVKYNQPVLYLLEDIETNPNAKVPKRSFVREELQVIEGLHV